MRRASGVGAVAHAAVSVSFFTEKPKTTFAASALCEATNVDVVRSNETTESKPELETVRLREG
jgi:hypothetical protein